MNARVSDTARYLSLLVCSFPIHGLSNRVEKCARLSSLCILLVLFAISHPKHARQASYFSEPLPSPPHLPSFTRIFPPDRTTVRGVATLSCLPCCPFHHYHHHHHHLLLLLLLLLLFSYHHHQYLQFAPLSYGCCGMFCRMQTRTNCSRERTAVRTSEPLAPISFFDCCPCLDTRPCEHVRDSRMRSNLVST